MLEHERPDAGFVVVPNIRRDEVVGRYGDGWKIRLRAVPERGKANEQVVRLLSEVLGLKPGSGADHRGRGVAGQGGGGPGRLGRDDRRAARPWRLIGMRAGLRQIPLGHAGKKRNPSDRSCSVPRPELTGLIPS